MNDSVWKVLFAVAALFNFIAGLPPLLAPDLAVGNFGLAAMPHNIFVQLTGALVVTFGIGYAFVSRDLNLREIVWMGVIGKAIVVVLMVYYRSLGTMPDAPFYTAMGDLVFVVAFLAFLFMRKKSA